MNAKNTDENIIIIGSGPAGLTAAIYAARAELSPLVIEGESFGGQLMMTSLVENFPGFENGIMGPDLMISMKNQASKQGARFVSGNVTEVDFTSRPFKVMLGDSVYTSLSVIIATGAKARWLDIESAHKFRGRGVSACAICDGPLFKNKDVVVVGGGDAAMEEAVFLTKFAKKIYIVHRRDRFTASKAMQEKVFSNEKIKTLFSLEVTDVLGDDFVTGIRLRNVISGKESALSVQGVFLAIGHVPDTDLFKGHVDLDEKGYIVLKDGTRSSVDGVFVAGDVADYRYRQAVTAAGFGCMAALNAIKFLEGH